MREASTNTLRFEPESMDYKNSGSGSSQEPTGLPHLSGPQRASVGCLEQSIGIWCWPDSIR